MRSRILVVAAENALRTRLARLLRQASYAAELADGIAQARRIGLSGFALGIVAPAGLGADAGKLIEDLERAAGPVLLVSAAPALPEFGRDVLHEAAGAVLLARVAEALEPAQPEDDAKPVLLFGHFRLDLSGHSLSGPGGAEIALTAGEFRLLHAFVQRPGRVLSREFLMQAMAGRDTFDNSVNMAVSRLRGKIEADPRRPVLIVTVAGAGYKFTARPHAEMQGTAPPSPPAARHAERRQITALAAELVAAPGQTLPPDPEELAPILDAYLSHMAALAARHGGIAGPSLGRLALAWFGYPEARETSAEPALDAALALAGTADLPTGCAIRVGVASGQVVVQTNGVLLGEPPAEATRLAGLAAPGQVVAADSTRLLAGGLFAYRDIAGAAAWRVLGAGVEPDRFTALRSAGTPLVGRAEELDLLHRRWVQTTQGEGRVALITGEAGIGKSRLVAGLNDRIAVGSCIRLSYHCAPTRAGTALHPVVSQLEGAAFFLRDDSEATKLEKLRTLLDRSGASPAQLALIAGLFTQGLGAPAPPHGMDAQKRKDAVLDALLCMVRGLANQKPVLILCEDAHWIDSLSLELLELISRYVARLPVLLLVTCRPDCRLPWSTAPNVTHLTLSRLSRQEAAALADGVAGPGKLPAALRDQILARTDGVPLFVEEFTRATLDSPSLAELAARWRMGVPLDIPATLQDSLMARLDRLGWPRTLAQHAAALGREFSPALLAAISGLAPERVQQGLQDLVAAQILVQRRAGAEAHFSFSHALLQDAAYNTLLRGERQALHGRIAAALEADFQESAQASPDVLAHHLTEAGRGAEAIAWWRHAGQRNLQASANQEAAAHFRRCLTLLSDMLPSASRDETELDIRVELGVALTGTNGYTAVEFRENTESALEICERLGERTRLFPVLWGMVAGAFSAGDVQRACALSERFLSAAEAQNDPQLRMIGHRLTGMALFGAGLLEPARLHLETSLALYDADRDSGLAYVYGFDQRVASLAYLARTLHLQGFAEQGMRLAMMSVEESARHGHANTTLYAAYCLLDLHMLRQDRDSVAATSREAGRMAHSHAAYNLQLESHCVEAIMAVLHGGGGDALAACGRHLSELRALNWIYVTTRLLMFAADAACAAGHAGQARLWLDEARGLIEELHQDACRPELYRVQAAVLRAEGAADDTIVQSLRLSVAYASTLGARWLELCAAHDLARLMCGCGLQREAESLLSAALAALPEQGKLHSVTGARNLLDSLASGNYEDTELLQASGQ